MFLWQIAGSRSCRKAEGYKVQPWSSQWETEGGAWGDQSEALISTIEGAVFRRRGQQDLEIFGCGQVLHLLKYSNLFSSVSSKLLLLLEIFPMTGYLKTRWKVLRVKSPRKTPASQSWRCNWKRRMRNSRPHNTPSPSWRTKWDTDPPLKSSYSAITETFWADFRTLIVFICHTSRSNKAHVSVWVCCFQNDLKVW